MSKARDIADLDFNSPDIDGGNIDGAVIGGTTPAAGTFSGLTTDSLNVGTTSDAYSSIFLISSATNGESELRMGDTDTDAGSIAYTNADNTMTFRAAAASRMTIDSAGIDVAGLVKIGVNNSEYANNYIRFKPTGAAYIDHNTVGQSINFRTSVSSSLDTTPLTIASTGAATFNSNIVFGDGHFIGDDADDNLWLAGGSNENIIIDSAEDIFLDAANQNINLRVAGSTFGRLTRTSSAYLSVQSNGGNLRLGANNTDYWSIDEYRIYPVTDAVDDIGLANNRVKDLYLSGGVFLGGTGAANKLDSYEEGTFTPEVQNGTYTYAQRRGHYVKIGNMVYAHIGLRIGTASSVTGAVGRITGLPFTSTMYGSYQEPHARIGTGGVFVTSSLGSHLSFYVDNNQTRLMARTSVSNADTPIASNAIWQAGTFIKLTVIYTVS